MNVDWHGVFPAVTTQYDENLDLDLKATQNMVDRLIEEGVHGVIALGTVGENNSHTAEEKRQTLSAIVDVVNKRVPVITGVSEFTTMAACDYAKDAAKIGVDGLMVLPAMSYVPDNRELEYHIRTVSAATDLPVMIYNNPAAYRVNIPVEVIVQLSEVENIVALKESAEDTRRYTDIINACGDNLILMAGLDDVALEGMVLGSKGWVSGLTNVFPQESIKIIELLNEGRLEEAREIYRWFLPLLHLDAQPNLVQCIKLAEQVAGRGSERVRPPRLDLVGEERARVIEMVETAMQNRPTVS